MTERDVSTALIRVDGLVKEFSAGRDGRTLRVLDGISFEVERGSFVAVVGPSGCGKTTLLRLLAGMLQPEDGTIDILGAGLDHSRIGFVFQQASLYPWRTVADNIGFGLELRVRRKRNDLAKPLQVVRDLIELVGLRGFGSYYPAQISGGMQQRTNLGRALAIDPELLLMDEPFSALDAQTREDLQIELQRIAVEAASTVIFITHDIREAVYLADRVLVLSPAPARIIEDVRVPTPRPREFDYQVSDEFNELTRRIWGIVHRPDPAKAPTTLREDAV